MATRGVNVAAAALGLAGVVLLWSGLHGASVSGSLRTLLAGRTPDPSVEGAGAAVGAAAAGGVLSGTEAANLRLQATTYGWAIGSQWAALTSLWPHWQAPGATADTTDQVRVGLAYIKARHGTPTRALAARAFGGSY